MTTSMIDLHALTEKSSDGDWLREMIGFAAERLMEIEVEGLCGAGFGERSDERTNHRNGYRERRWETRAGALDLKIPKLRKGSYLPAFLEPRRVHFMRNALAHAHKGQREMIAAMVHTAFAQPRWMFSPS